jgi:quercetin dioxygenase-like cupin family protein
MSGHTVSRQVGHLVDPSDAETFDVLGPTVQFLTHPEGGDDEPCVMRGTIPPGVFVPLHTHADPETFLMISGDVEGLAQRADGGHEWIRIAPGDMFHVPGGAKHAFRNQSQAPAVMILITTVRLGRFFREVGTLVVAGKPPRRLPPEAVIQRFLTVSDRYGYWNASPGENAQVGIVVPALHLA